jgi:hypothetical protein
LLFLLTFVPLLGQTAQVTGRIMDQTGASVPGVEVTITAVETGAVHRSVSNELGLYTVPLLPPGRYKVDLRKTGLKSVTQDNVTLIVDQVARLDFSMEVGAITESVQVTAPAPILDQETSALGQLIDSTKIANIPLNGRSSFRLVQLTPGLISAPSAGGQFGDIPVNTTWDTNFSINGGRAQSNEVLIDGVPATSGFFNQITTIPSIEATQEFKVQSNNLSAEWGRFNGGVVNVSTRSGANQVHGALYEFVRNSAFDANDFFNNRAGKGIPPFRMNQFGGAIGGPVELGKLYHGKNRTFFFADYQGTRYRRGEVNFFSLPTGAQRNGDFTQTFSETGALVTIYDPLTTRTVGNTPTRDVFPGNRLPQNRIDPAARKALDYYPLPNLPGDRFTAFNNYISNASRKINEDQLSGRIDHTVNNSYRLFGRVAGNNTSLTQPNSFGNLATPDPGAVGTTAMNQRTGAFDNIVTINPTTILDVRYGFARWYQLRQTLSFGFDQRTLGLPDSFVKQLQIPAFPNITVEQYAGLGGQSYLSNGNDTHTLLASVTHVRGRHTFKTGVDLRLRRINFFNSGNPAGTYAFNRNFTRGPNPNVFYADAGSGVASELLGTAASGGVPYVAGVSIQNFYYAGFLQDDIRLSSRLTINVGLRYETESPYTERRNQINWFDTNLPSPVKNSQYPNLTGGLRFAGVDGNPRTVYQWDTNNFAPRLGLAYTLTSRTVFRAGAGVFYGPLDITTNAVGSTPSNGYSANSPMLATLDGGLTPNRYFSNPFPEGLVQPTRNTLGAATYLGQAPSTWDATAVNGVTYQWNADLQQQLANNILIDVAYAGSRGVHLAFRNREIDSLDPKYLSLGNSLNDTLVNPFAGQISVGTLSQPRVTRRQLLLPYPQFTSVQLINQTSANSVYHSLQLKAEKRFAQGVTFLTAYTAGKLIADAPNQVAPIGPGATPAVQNWYDLRSERSVSEMDISQAFTFSAVAELPFGKGKRFLGGITGPAARLIEGWQLNGVLNAHTGVPLSLTAPIPGGGNRPNSTGKSANISGSRSHGDQVARWFDTTQFTLPPSFSLGNVSRTLPDVRAPGFSNVDLSLIKNTRIRERVSLQFRAEYFNLFNHANFNPPNTGFGSGQFGQITATAALPRVGQLALKLNF